MAGELNVTTIQPKTLRQSSYKVVSCSCWVGRAIVPSRLLCETCATRRWALLYTLPDAAKGDVRRDFLNTILAELYDFFYK